MKKLRIGVLGSGAGPTGVGSSRGTYLGTLAEQTELMDTVAVCGIVQEHVEHGAALMRDARPYTDFDAFLQSGLDAVIIATPVYQHTQQAIAFLEAGIPVLSEVTPVNSLTEAAQLAAAVERTGGFYMLAENYRFINDVELVKRMVDDGRFGHIHFAEGEYLHDTRDLRQERDGSQTWRGQPNLRGGLYCTHSLGPILYITGDRVATVSCVEPDGGVGGTLMTMKTDKGAVFKVRLDGNSPRPHNMAFYSVQGNKGAFEGQRGLGDEAKVWLDDVHEPSYSSARALGKPIAQWHPLREFAQEYIGDRLAGPEAAKTSGHFGADYWMLEAFAKALIEGRHSPIDVYQALDYGVPGIVAMASKANLGAPMPVPDYRPKPLPEGVIPPIPVQAS
jgi:predicted dehydrogenase